MVDFQNDFCSPEVAVDGPPVNTQNAATARRANVFAARAAELGSPVIYTRQVLDLDRLTWRQRRWEVPDGLCAAGSWGAELFVDPVSGADVVVKDRFDTWQSQEFVDVLETRDIDGLVICGVELVCCILYAVLGAQERGYHYLVPPDLVSGQDLGDETDNRAVRDFLAANQADHYVPSAEILARWAVGQG
jgi:nicotinamidase-related amidase